MAVNPSPIIRPWRQRKRIKSYRAMIFTLLTIISMIANAAVIDAVSEWHGNNMFIEMHPPNCAGFICLPRAISLGCSTLGDGVDSQNIVIQPPFRSDKSTHVLEFWLRRNGLSDFDSMDGSQPSPIIRDYKHIDDEDVSYSIDQAEGGMILYNETSHAMNMTSVPESKRSRLAFYLRKIRPLVVPLWMLPLLPTETPQEEIVDNVQIHKGVANGTNTKITLALPRSEDKELAISTTSGDSTMSGKSLNVSEELDQQMNQAIDAEIVQTVLNSESDTGQSTAMQLSDAQSHNNDTIRRSFFRRRRDKYSNTTKVNKPILSKDEATCPVIVSNIQELREAVLINQVPLKDVGFRFPVNGIGSEIVPKPINATSETKMSLYIDNPLTRPEKESSVKAESIFQRYDPVINGTLSSLLTCASDSSFNRNSTEYQQGIDLLSNHPVLSLLQERARTNSTPANRLPSDDSHLALVIEGGGMRGAVSAGMAAALSTLDLLDTFDSVHGSSAGAIIGAYIVSRQLCTDVYTDIMPAAGNRFASKKRTLMNVGVDWLADLVSSSESNLDAKNKDTDDSDAVCELVDDVPNSEIDGNAGNASMWVCEDDMQLSSVELAMARNAISPRRRSHSDDHGLLYESMDYLVSRTRSTAKRIMSKPLAFGLKYSGQAFDLAASMGQYLRRKPGMNLTYVLDGIMDETHGLRPFDMEAFKANDKKQPLYIVASSVSNGGVGKMETLAFNSADGDFFGSYQDLGTEFKVDENVQQSWYRYLWNSLKRTASTMYSTVYNVIYPDKPKFTETILPPGTNAIGGLVHKKKKQRPSQKQQKVNFFEPTGRINNEGKCGLFTCLESSMLVPGIGNEPINLIRSRNRKLLTEPNRLFPGFLPRRQAALVEKQMKEQSHLCYDAFCYEPIPYRSAVEKAAATHVLALRSRPDGCIVETKQHLYEQVIGPIYFRKHGMNNVAKLFSSGGSQYRYIEDVLTLNEGLTQGVATGIPVKVPPTKLLFGTEEAEEVSIDEWESAHLLPIALPFGTPELPTLSQDREQVLKAVRHGYAAAFDILAPVAGLPFDSKTIPGERVAEILFPGGDDDVEVLNQPVKIKPSYIGVENREVVKELRKRERFAAWVTGKREAKRRAQEEVASHPQGALAQMIKRRSSTYHESDQYVRDASNTLEWLETEALLAALPGFRNGKLDHIAESLLAKEERKQEK